MSRILQGAKANYMSVSGLALVLIASAPSAALCQTPVIDRPACVACAIKSQTIRELGTTDGAAAILGEVSHVATDSKARYWIFSKGEMPLVFSAGGKVIGRVGHKGEGPGEFQYPERLLQLPGDSVAVYEFFGRVTVFNSALKAIRTLQMPFENPKSALVLSWPSRVVVNAAVRTPNAMRWPIHQLSFASPETHITKSFGAGDGRMLPGTRGFAQLQAFIAPARGGGFWSTDGETYTIRKWDHENRQVASLQRRPRWFNELTDWTIGGPNVPPKPRLVGVHEDEQGLLWTFVLVPSLKWRAAWKKVQVTSAASEVRTKDIYMEFLFDTRVEVIDPHTMRVLAISQHDGQIMGILPQRRAAFTKSAPDGSSRVQIVQLTLQRAQR